MCIGSDRHDYNTRRKRDFLLSKPRLELAKRKPTYAGTKFYNSLPEHLKHQTKFLKFKRELKNYLLEMSPYSFDEFF